MEWNPNEFDHSTTQYWKEMMGDDSSDEGGVADLDGAGDVSNREGVTQVSVC